MAEETKEIAIETLPIACLQLVITAMREVNITSKQIKEVLTFLLEND